MKKIIDTENAPSAKWRAFSQWVVANWFLYTAGQVAIDPKEWKFIWWDIVEQTHQVMKNLKAIIEASWSSMEQCIKCTIYLSNMDNYSLFNGVYAEYFDEKTAPARECIGISELPLGAEVEISLIAVV